MISVLTIGVHSHELISVYMHIGGVTGENVGHSRLLNWLVGKENMSSYRPLDVRKLKLTSLITIAIYILYLQRQMLMLRSRNLRMIIHKAPGLSLSWICAALNFKSFNGHDCVQLYCPGFWVNIWLRNLFKNTYLLQNFKYVSAYIYFFP